MKSTTFGGCGADRAYPWACTLAHYLVWQRVHLELAFEHRDASDPGRLTQAVLHARTFLWKLTGKWLSAHALVHGRFA